MINLSHVWRSYYRDGRHQATDACGAIVENEPGQAHFQQRALTQHDMLPQHTVNIKELFCEYFLKLL